MTIPNPKARIRDAIFPGVILSALITGLIALILHTTFEDSHEQTINIFAACFFILISMLWALYMVACETIRIIDEKIDTAFESQEERLLDKLGENIDRVGDHSVEMLKRYIEKTYPPD